MVWELWTNARRPVWQRMNVVCAVGHAWESSNASPHDSDIMTGSEADPKIFFLFFLCEMRDLKIFEVHADAWKSKSVSTE